MDLYAYTQIDELEEIAKKNGIDVPRLRGYRLMKDEEALSEDELKEACKGNAIGVACDLIRSNPKWSLNPYSRTCSDYTDWLCRYYLVTELDENGVKWFVDIRWDRIHGKKRKNLKFAIKKQKEKILKQYEIWNKYVGRDDVLYIRARIGGNNWSYFGGPNKVASQPWFLEKVDDWYDSTYCDIYAKICPVG